MPDSPFVSQSLMKSSWVLPDVTMDAVEQMARRHDLPEIVARLLCARGVDIDDAQRFLYPTLKNDFPDPFLLKDMDRTAAFLAQAIRDKKNIAIFGDFDVDGATSSALLYRFLKACGIEAPIYIPDRLTEGYGPNAAALRQLKEQGADIVVLLDCGTTAFEPVQAGRDCGLDIVIIDHHEAEENLPNATHIVNPKRKDDTSGLTMLAACGMTFMTCVAVNSLLRKENFYEGKEPPLKDWLDLVALGTVCDMVPLTGVNRLFVKAGFQRMARRENPGIKALLEVAKVNSDPTVYHAGFIIGPRINAGGRIHKSDLGAKLLATDDPAEANSTAWLLHDCNEKRKDMQAQMEREAMDKVESLGLHQHPAIIVDDKEWHPGLAGLVAGRLKDKYGKPACVVTYNEGEGKGSGRSIPGVHIAQVFIDARAAGLLEKGGGHAMAGGFSLRPENIAAFSAFVCEHVKKQSGAAVSSVRTTIDSMISVRGVRADFVKLIYEHAGPFGQEQPEPLFLLNNVRIHMADVLKDAHVRLQVSDWEGGSRIKAMAFKAVGTPLGDALLKQGRQPFHLLGYLKINEWQGRESVEFHVKDAAFAMAEREVLAG